MKIKIQYAQNSTTLLPKVDPLFRIRNTLLSGRQIDKTSSEFGECLMVLLGRRGDRQEFDYSRFQRSLENLEI